MEIAQFPASEFDDWAESYDQDVLADSAFPFTGYADVLDSVLALAQAEPGMRVLDLGTGTANLAQLFHQHGCQLWCSDFSAEMLAIARQKLPQAVFVQADLLADWPAALAGPFERIISAYVFHHFTLPVKIDLLHEAARRLSPGGRMVLADIAFQDHAGLEAARQAAGDAWEEEHYWVAEEARPALQAAGFTASYRQVSACGGIFVIQPAHQG